MGKIKVLKHKPVRYMITIRRDVDPEIISFRESGEGKQVYLEVRTVEKAICLLTAAGKYAESHRFDETFTDIEPMQLLREIL